jgi:hypothetical protein
VLLGVILGGVYYRIREAFLPRIVFLQVTVATVL